MNLSMMDVAHGDDLPVAHLDFSVRPVGELGVVRDEQDATAVVPVQTRQQIEDDITRMRVEVPSRLIREQPFRAVDEGAGDGDPLLLATGQLRRQRVRLIAQSDFFQQFERPFLPVIIDFPSEQRCHDVLECRQCRDQVELLEDETDVVEAEVGELFCGQGRDRFAVEQERAIGRTIERTNQAE